MSTGDFRYYFSVDDIFALLKLLAIPAGIFLTMFTLWSVVEVREYLANPTSKRLKHLIETEIPPGTDKAEILSFLERNQIGHSGYRQVPVREKSGEAFNSQEFTNDKLKNKLDRINYRIYAGRDVSDWRSLTPCWTNIWFYFDDKGKLVEYVARRFCDGL